MTRHLLLPLIAALPLAAADWNVDAVHSTAMFRIQHMGAGFTWGRFKDLEGTVSYDAANPGASKIALTIKTATVSTGVPKMEEHLRTPDLLDVKQFPTMSFTSTAWKVKPDGSSEVTGDLTIHGVTKSVTVPVSAASLGKNPMNNKELIGFTAVFPIQRADFGVTYGKGALGDEVRITIEIEAEKK